MKIKRNEIINDEFIITLSVKIFLLTSLTLLT